MKRAARLCQDDSIFLALLEYPISRLRSGGFIAAKSFLRYVHKSTSTSIICRSGFLSCYCMRDGSGAGWVST